MRTKHYFITKTPVVALLLVAMLCLSAWACPALGQTSSSLRPYAVLDGEGTLTFKYDDKPTLGDGEYALNEGDFAPDWNGDPAAGICKVVFDESFKEARPTTCAYWFSGCKNLTTIEGIENLNTEEVTSMSCMFDGCESLTAVDVSQFDTRKVTLMSLMFNGCAQLTTLDVSHFATDEVVNMSSMFAGCKALTSLDLSGFDTRKVTDMNSMFQGCGALTALHVSSFNTSRVTNMCYMFYGCSGLTTLDLSHFDTRRVTDMNHMFTSCYRLVSLDVKGFDTQNVTDMGYMFYDCRCLSELDLSGFDTQLVTDMSSMFNRCRSLEAIYVSDKFTTHSVTADAYMFSSCGNLKGAKGYESNNNGKEYANYETGYFTRLWARVGDEKILTDRVDALKLTDDTDLAVFTPFTVSTVTYTRTLSGKSEWASLCLPFEVSLAEQPFRAFTLLSATADAVQLTELTGSIPAGTPVFIKVNKEQTDISLSAQNVEIKDVASGSATQDNSYQLVGLYAAKTFDAVADANCYILKADRLMNLANVVGEGTGVKAVKSRPYRAYIKGSAEEPAGLSRVLGIDINGGVTAIDSPDAPAGDSPAEYYDLQGRRLEGPRKGINIVKRGAKTLKVIIN